MSQKLIPFLDIIMAERMHTRWLLVLVHFAMLCLVIIESQFKCWLELNPDEYDAFFDFEKQYYRNFSGISLIEGLQGTGCSTKGLFKLTFSKNNVHRQRLLIDLGIDTPRGWTFNLGDSRTNHGWGGDEGTQSNDAEFQLIGIISGHYNKFYGGGIAFSLINRASSRMTIMVGNEHTLWIPDMDMTEANFFQGPGWFALDGQYDLDGDINYDLYLAVNRVVSSADVPGSGVCKLGIKFVPAL